MSQPELAPALDKALTPRHDSGAVIRVLRFLALFTAFFVVTVRGLSGFPLLAACAALPELGTSGVCPASEAPRENDTLAPVAVGDWDDGADAVIAPSPLRVRLSTSRDASRNGRGALAAERALPSHAPSLERPPRA
ncbi:MAG TPA: hypothetical protein VJV79_32050 [Polyangiaceae bacterium]|nr:hypothetical protein [Polyangiaceae bacterium]